MIVLYLPKMWSFVSKMIICIIHTVDGRNPAPSGMYKPSKWWECLPYQLVIAGFLNHQYIHLYILPPKTDYPLQGQSWDGQQEWPWRIGMVNMKNFTEEGSVRDYSSKFQCIQKFWETLRFFLSQEEDYVNLSLLQCLVSVAGWRVVAWAALVGWCLGELHGSLFPEMGQNHEDANVWTCCTYASI